MTIKVGFLKSDTQTIIKELDLNAQTVSSSTISTQDIKKEPLNLLFFKSSEQDDQQSNYIKDEEKFYPILEAASAQVDAESFENLNFDQLFEIFNKIHTRWILSRNIQTIENLYPTITYLKELWINDRNSFFEELWFLLRTNLGANALNIIFNDLKLPSEKQKEKGEKPKLCHSFVKGKKMPQIFEGTEAETKLMKDYQNEFNESFNITEYNANSGQLVFCATIEKSPILVMANLMKLNQLQRSVVSAIFTGLQ